MQNNNGKSNKYPFIAGGHWIDISKFIIIDKTTFKFVGIKCPRCSFVFNETRENVSHQCPDCGLVVSNVGDGTLYLVESSDRVMQNRKEQQARVIRENDNKEAKEFAYRLFAGIIREKVEQFKTWKTVTAIN